MTDKLKKALSSQKDSKEPVHTYISGILGIPLSGHKVVEVANRNAYVYVRLRNNQSEVIQAFNNQVSPSYNLPVLVERQGNRYVVVSIDTQRYDNNWSSFAPFLPRHGNTHSFDLESGGGGDVVWVQSRQITPLLAMPSGSDGGPNVIINPYTIKNADGTWKYIGNTGTQNITSYRPSSPTGAIMALVYADSISGNPYLLVGSGTVFSNAITGTSAVARYIPSITNPDHIPLAAIRLITGSSVLSWNNIYDVRQWLHVTPTGTSGGSASINTGTLDARYLKLDTSNDPLYGQLRISGSVSVINDSGVGSYFESSDGLPVLDIEQFSSVDPDETMFLYRSPIGVSTPKFLEPVISVWEDSVSGSIYGGILKAKIDGTDRLELNPHATGTNPAYLFDTAFNRPTGTKLASFKDLGTEKIYFAEDGTVNISTGTYKIGGTPHFHASYLPFGVFSSISPLTVDNSIPYNASIDKLLTFVRWSQSWFVTTTNTGVHYWTISLYKGNGVLVKAFNTSAGAADTWTLNQATTFDVANCTASDVKLYIVASKTSSPGSLYLGGPTLEFS